MGIRAGVNLPFGFGENSSTAVFFAVGLPEYISSDYKTTCNPSLHWAKDTV